MIAIQCLGGGGRLLMGNYPRRVGVYMPCVRVSANLQCMRIFEIDHMFCEARRTLRTVCACSPLITLISSAEFTAFISGGGGVVVITLSVYRLQNVVFPYRVMRAGCQQLCMYEVWLLVSIIRDSVSSACVTGWSRGCTQGCCCVQTWI